MDSDDTDSESFDDEQSAEVHAICDHEPVNLVMYSSSSSED